MKSIQKSNQKPNQLSAFAVTAPGLEDLCVRELAALGVRGKVVEGGVSWSGDLASVARANLWLRTASRVLVRVAEFRATAFFELELNAKKLPWKRFVAAGQAVEFRVTCRKSKLYHSGAVAQRFGQAVMQAVRGVKVDESSGSRESNEEQEDTASADRQLFVVRFVHDVATVSVDSSGTLLHMRGYRQAIAKAPLRETLAAAVLLGAGWDGTTPLTDPMCGSGTIPIEAALIARRMAPGRNRSFAFVRWPELDQKLWTTLLAQAKAGELAASPVKISGYDRDEGAIAAARANAERAGVAADVELAVQPISAMSTEVEGGGMPGLVASNPPYGVRMGESDRLRNLYAQLANVLRAKRPGWRLALLSADRELERQLRLELETKLTTRNGGIKVRLVVADVSQSGIETAPSVGAGRDRS